MRITREFIVNIVLILALGILVSATGLFLQTAGEPFEVTNPSGDRVMLAGQGLYAMDSFLKAPIFRATDAVMLFLAVPLLLISLILLLKKASLRHRLLITAVLAVFTYYSASLAFGVAFNNLHLAYIALFSASLIGLVVSAQSLAQEPLADAIHSKLPYRGFHIFLILSGAALILAWLPDILAAHQSGRSLALIEVYTTEITYVLDMGLIGPSALIASRLLAKRRASGFVLLTLLLMLCAVIGVMLPVQTLFQAQVGIVLPMPVLITKVGTFCLLSVFAAYFLIRLLRAIQTQGVQSERSMG